MTDSKSQPADVGQLPVLRLPVIAQEMSIEIDRRIREVAASETWQSLNLTRLVFEQLQKYFPEGSVAEERQPHHSAIPSVKEFAETWDGFKSQHISHQNLRPLADWREAVAIRFAEAYLRLALAERQQELSLWKRSMCVLYEIMEENECPLPSAAIGLTTSALVKLQAELRQAQERIAELEGK